MRPLLVCAAALAALIALGAALWLGRPAREAVRLDRPGAFTVELMDGRGAVLQSREATVGAGETVEVDLR